MLQFITFVLNIATLVLSMFIFWNLYQVMKKDPFTGKRVIDKVIWYLIKH